MSLRDCAFAILFVAAGALFLYNEITLASGRRAALINAMWEARTSYAARCQARGGHLTHGQWYLCLTVDGRIIEL